MPDQEKVILGLKHCGSNFWEGHLCKGCPYFPEMKGCMGVLHHDALALLREQEPRVLSAEEIRSGEAVVVWLEDKDRENVIPGLWFRLSNEGGDEAVDIHVMDGFIGARLAEYNKRWRAWTAQPSDEQRKAVAWNDSGENKEDS